MHRHCNKTRMKTKAFLFTRIENSFVKIIRVGIKLQIKTIGIRSFIHGQTFVRVFIVNHCILLEYL